MKIVTIKELKKLEELLNQRRESFRVTQSEFDAVECERLYCELKKLKKKYDERWKNES